MGLDACGRLIEVPDNYNVGADGAPGEVHDFLSLVGNIPGGVWDAAKSTAHSVASAASGAWNLAANNDGARERFRNAMDHATTAVHDGAVQAWNHPGDTLSAAAHRAAGAIDSIGDTCPSDAGQAVGGLMLNYATGKVVASTVGKVAGVVGDVAGGGSKPARAALETPTGVAPDAPLAEPVNPVEIAPPEPPLLRATPRDGVVDGKPTGKPEAPDPRSRRDVQDGINTQVKSGEALAKAGYRVEWQPQVLPADNIKAVKKPDIRLGGNIADVVAPVSPDPDQVRKALSAKVKRGQAYHLVLNLDRTDVTREQVEAILRRRPITGLRELITIEKNGAISRTLPDPAQIVSSSQSR